MGLIADAVDGWAGGLAAAAQATGNLTRSRERVRLVAADGHARLFTPSGKPVAEFAIPEDGPAAAPPEVRRRLQGCDVEMLVPGAAVLARELDPLPRESRPYLDNIVRHRLDRVFPWRTDEIVYRAVPEDRADGRLDVTVFATPRKPLADAFAVAGAVQAGRLIIVAGPSGDADEAPPEIVVPIEDKAAGGARAVTLARYILLGVLLAGTAGVAWTSYETLSLEGQVEDVNQAIAGRRAVLAKAAEQNRAEGAGGLQALKQDGPVAVVLMEAVSATLPDDTYLTDFGIAEGRMRLSGVSGSVTDLVPLLESSGHVQDVKFFAPTVRIPDSSRDRFNIEAVIVPKQRIVQ